MENSSHNRMNNFFPFLSLQLKGSEPTWCVDGRPDFTKEKGPQMLGGSLHPLVLKAIQTNGVIDNQSVNGDLNTLTEHGFPLGAHRDKHDHNRGKCGCGFADRLPEIIQTAQSQREKITTDLAELGINNIESVYDLITSFNIKNIKISGESLVAAVEEKNGSIENLEGNHNESVAFVNLKAGTTLDTNGLNKQNQQAFNLDLWTVIEQSKTLGVSEDFAKITSLILYMATEIVLVEQNGKPKLTITIHS